MSLLAAYDREMRSATVFVIAVLLIAAALLMFWQPLRSVFVTGAVPGQYPIDTARPEWPVKEVTKAYRPAAEMTAAAAAVPGSC
jgi:hypothetical protein